MKRKLFFLFATILMGFGFSAKAQMGDFSVMSNGNLINYKISSPNSVRVFLGDYSGAITIPSSVPHNGIMYTVTAIDDTAFANYSPSTGITSISLPNTIDSIGLFSFGGCTNLSTITFPSSVKLIKTRAFRGCTNLASITSHAVIPPTIIDSAFKGVSLNIPVTVPCGSLALYQAAPFWNMFTNFIADTTSFSTVIYDSIAQGGVYTLNGFNEDSAGVYTQNLQTANGCDSLVTLHLSVYTLITPASFTIANTTNGISLSWNGNGKSYIVYRDNVSIANLQETSFEDTTVLSGVNYCYQVRAIADNIESDLSQPSCQTFSGLKDVLHNDIHTKLYPNPAQNKTILEIQGLKNSADVFLYDIFGKEIKAYKLGVDQTQLEIDLEGLLTGVYNLSIVNSDCRITNRLIVK